jgi:RNA polymerase-associated protein RTF1
VRYLIGNEGNQPVYRICEISSTWILRSSSILPNEAYALEDLAVDLAKPYKINNQLIDQNIELKHGTAVKAFPMDKVSNGEFTAVGPYSKVSLIPFH